MSESSQRSSLPLSWLWRNALAAALVWTVFIAASVGANVLAHWREMLEEAGHEARNSFQKDLLSIFWENGHGDADAPTTNNALSSIRRARAPERDRIIPPAMMRQMKGHSPDELTHRSHLAGQNPLRPENAPDAWECRALKAFAQGETEISSVGMIAGLDYLRVMRPLVIEAECLTCHSAQDYKTGNIRGGLSISVPLAPIWAHEMNHMVSMFIGHGVIWFMGLGFIGFGARHLQTHSIEQAKAAEALRDSTDHLEEAQRLAHIGSWHWTIATDTVKWSETLCHINGRDPGLPAPCFAEMSSCYTPESWNRLSAAVTQALHTGESYELELEMVRPDGTTRHMFAHGEADYDAGGKLVGLHGAVQDITVRKQAEKAVEQSRAAALNIMEDAVAARDQAEQASLDMRCEMARRQRAEEAHDRLTMAVEQSGETIVITDASATILYANPAFETTTGYTREEALGQTSRLLKSGKQDAEFYGRMWAALSRGEVWNGHFINKRKDGTLYEEDASISPVRDAAGKIINYVAVKRDVTRETQLENQLRQTQKLEAVGRLAGGVAHDFNNLIMGIMGYTDLCRDQIGHDHPIREWLDEITRIAQRSARITRQLLTFARKQSIEPKVMDLNDAVADMLKLLRRLIGEDINLAWMPGADLRPVRLDPSQFDQILANLCLNARDAITSVGKITLATGNVTLDADYCAGRKEARPGAYVLLSVSDDGWGMSPETMAQIFEPFFTTKGIGKGTGLGLATVYGIVKQNDGFIDVYSELGLGTTFKLYLPQVAAEAVKIAATPAPEVPQGRGETILLVEDEQALRTICRKFLEALGYNVLEVETPGEALKLAGRHPGDIHLLLTDVVMPGMDGWQLAQQISAVKPGVKVLFMSGYTADVIVQRGVQEQNMAFIAKPFTRDDLARKVHSVLEPQVS